MVVLIALVEVSTSGGRARHLDDLCHGADRQRGLHVRRASGLHQHVVGLRREAVQRHGQFVLAEIEVHKGVVARLLGDGRAGVVRGEVRQGQMTPREAPRRWYPRR